MPNYNPKRIPDSQRGHRPPIDANDPSKTYTIALPGSVTDWCRLHGANKIREYIISLKKSICRDK